MKLIPLIVCMNLMYIVSYAKDGCPHPNHNLGHGEKVKHGACIAHKDATGKITHYSQYRYHVAEHGDCAGTYNSNVHCDIIYQTVLRGTFTFPPEDSGCNTNGAPLNYSSEILQVRKITNCTYTPDNAQPGD